MTFPFSAFFVPIICLFVRKEHMRRTLRFRAGFLQNLNSGRNNFFTSLWNKPQTRDERVKEYVPEVLAESLEEQRAVLEENTSRDVIVELGHKVLREIENKSPTPSIAPHLNKIIQEYGSKDLIAQRPLSYLLYPSSTLIGGQLPNELVANFSDNLRSLVEEVERNGCSARHKSVKGEKKDKDKTKKEENVSHETSSSGANGENLSSALKSGPVVMASKEEHEPMDITLFVRVISAMALANVQHGDWNNAVRCVDVAIAHVVEQSRLGGLLGMKAGILVYQKKYEEAVECANLAVEASGNIQGYIHGAFALRILKRPAEAVQLLERGREQHPMNTQLLAQMEGAQKDLEHMAKDAKTMISS
ncbi:hypothetical protein ECC02_001408 [Trypanosoma cruzi]|uniref:Uncharacterized protein n=3 Tax=Trypanosoma cruzi TaxID=5693 RepID=Q4D7A9_TRYCC|nr:hypothetical protein, conserved [Trypanosoma cruzi]EAN88422.1 hypothetical protein, conserved [Trypanosoma cruzi]KAF5225644.1 hypothetical protein ECC02_001408 [Trypanosoma cruzi]|eukprot:XP_810273.1 hypothetical protein [Trypanosoma cruzi strain CL Brener]